MLISKPYAIVSGVVGAVAVGLLIWAAFFRSSGVPTEETCVISINSDLGDPQPLLLKPNGSDYDPFYLPEGTTDNITLHHGHTIILACPGSKITINSTPTNLTSITAKCVKGKQFQLPNQTEVPFSQINCTEFPAHTARYTGRPCSKDCREIEIGFEVEPSRFLPHILACFNESTQSAVYSHFNLTSKIGGYQSVFPRPSSFLQASFYSIHGVDRLYTRNSQRSVINSLLGLPENDTRYIHPSNSYFLARGHLTAKTDFVYGAQQRLTFYFVNAAPQWQTFNGGNWKVLEQDVRNYASDRELDLAVYTGTYGIATLPHAKTGSDVELFLYADENGNTAIPVPQVYWKYVYDPSNNAGAVFVGVNNPYRNKTVMICDDVSDAIKWLSWKKDDQTSGFCYACKVDDFVNVVDHLPQHSVDKLLI